MKKKEYKDYTVLILGAGMGTRLRPITDTIPKVMVEIAPGKPLLQHTIELLRDQGFRNFIINVHYLPEKIIEYFGNGERFGVSIIYSDESKRLMDTAGAIKKVERFLSRIFLLIYGDELQVFDFTKLVDFHEEKNALATMVLKKQDHPQNGEVIELEEQTKRFTAIYARPHKITTLADNMFLNAGMYAFSKKVCDWIPSNTVIHLDKEIFPKLFAEKQEIFGFPTDHEILDIGTPEKYSFARNWYRSYESKKGGHHEI